jgi:hypothetical protein
MEIDADTDAPFPEKEDETQSCVQRTQTSAPELESETRSDEKASISLETHQQEQQEGDAALDTCEDRPEQGETDDLPGVLDSGATTLQNMERIASVRRPRRYARWFQVLAVLMVMCLVGGVALAVRAWRSPNGQVHVTPHLLAPLAPLSVTRWCVANGAPVDPRAGRVTLTKVVALSSDDTWILGSTSQGNSLQGNSGREFPLLEHWDGNVWNIVPTADTSPLIRQLLHKIGGGQANESVILSDLTVLSTRSIWAVGNISVQKIEPGPASTALPNLAMVQSAGLPLIEHWDGTAWQIAANPPIASLPSAMPISFNRSGGMLSSISAVAANDIWVIGTQPVFTPIATSGNVPGGFMLPITNGPLVEHWNGESWKIVDLPASLQHERLLSIQAISATDVWAFGTEQQFLLSDFITLKPYILPPGSNQIVLAGIPQAAPSHLVHWNGQTWSTMSLPSNLGKKGLLLDVAAIADTDIWAIGESNLPGSKQSGLAAIEHWDGQTWSALTAWPQMHAKGTDLKQITVIGPENVWVTGSTGTHQPFMAHWDGKVWKVVVPTSPAYGSTKSLAVAGQRAWALVDEQQAPADQKISIPGVAPETIAEVIETSC